MHKILFLFFVITFLLITALVPINLANMTNRQFFIATFSLFIGILISLKMAINLWNKEKRIEAISFWIGFIVIGWPVYINAVHTCPGMYLRYKVYSFFLISIFFGCLLYILVLICLFLIKKIKELIKWIG